MIHTTLFKELALYFSEYIEHGGEGTSSGVGERAIVEPVFTAFIFDETSESHVDMNRLEVFENGRIFFRLSGEC